VVRKHRSGKRDLDLRDFWPWYERSINHGWPNAEPPPFSLQDIHDDTDDRPLPAIARRLLQVFYIVVAVVLFATVMYGVLH
jgi:hypothetical protein